MEVVNLSKKDSIISAYLSELRDVEVQNDRLRFRQNLSRIAMRCSFLISEELSYTDKKVTTPLGESNTRVLADQPVVACILRAGLAMHEGVMQVFEHADHAFISAMRVHHDDGSFSIELNYLAATSLEGKTVILADPMLATGASIITAVEALKKNGIPSMIYLISAIGSQEGIDYVEQHLDIPAKLFIGAIDPDLTPEAYISPGLGDAGDLAYGEKI